MAQEVAHDVDATNVDPELHLFLSRHRHGLKEMASNSVVWQAPMLPLI